MPTLSVAAVHVKLIWLELVVAAAGLEGTVGGCVSGTLDVIAVATLE
jgi:hypothetical protein